MAEIKGTALIDTIKAIKARVGEQEFVKIVQQLGPEAKSIFESRISPSSWYSLDAYVQLLETDIQETANGDREVLLARSEKVIEKQLRGIYKVFVQLGSPAFVIKRISAIHATYFHGVNIMPELNDSNQAVIKYAGFQARHEIMGYVILGFFRKALEISGAKQVTVEFTIPISASGDFAEVKITWACTVYLPQLTTPGTKKPHKRRRTASILELRREAIQPEVSAGATITLVLGSLEQKQGERKWGIVSKNPQTSWTTFVWLSSVN